MGNSSRQVRATTFHQALDTIDGVARERLGVTLLLREADVRVLLPMSEAVEVVRRSLASTPVSETTNMSRRRLPLRLGVLNVMSASVSDSLAAGIKAYSVAGRRVRFLVAVWDRDDGRLLALIEADHLGRMRTGAASGVATAALARPDAAVCTLIGCGRQARTQIDAILAVRQLVEIRVYCRNAEARSEFARALSQEVGIRVIPSTSAVEAVEGADIVSTITTSAHPVLLSEWLTPGTHVNASGSNSATRREIDGRVLQRAFVCVDSLEQARLEAGDLLIAAEEGYFDWSHAVELHHVLSGTAAAPDSDAGITLFKSLGIAIEDVAVARLVYDKALECGIGEQTTFGDVA